MTAKRKTRTPRVALIGWGPELPDSIRSDDAVTVREFLMSEIPPREVLVLGDAALARLEPEDVARRVRRTGETVLLVPSRCEHTRFLVWIRSGVGRVVRVDGLEDELRRLPLHPDRLTLGAWCSLAGIELDDELRELLGPVPGLERLQVGAWAAALGWTRDRLRRVCRARLHKDPSEVLWSYTVLTTDHLRRRRESLESIAPVVAYSDGSALARALRRRPIA